MASKFDPIKINIGSKEELKIRGYIYDSRKTLLTVLLTILSGGLLLILLSWKPNIKLFFTYRECSLHQATRIIVVDIYGQIFEEVVVEEKEQDGEKNKTNVRRYFINKKIKYVWDDEGCVFNRIKFISHGTTMENLHEKGMGLTPSEAFKQKSIFGENFIKIQVASIWELLVDQLILASAWLLICLGVSLVELFYGRLLRHLIFFSGVTFIYVFVYGIYAVPGVWQIRALKKRMTSLSKMKVLRKNDVIEVSTVELVPGDVVMVDSNVGTIEVDAVLLQGSVITNEAMLTGESVPVTKVELPYDDVFFDKELHKQHILFCGTQLLQVRGGKELPALVISTGFDTYKGELVRSILFPKPMDFHIYSDFIKLMLIFFILGLGAMCWSFYSWSSHGASALEIVFNSLDLMTFVIPPILPATITAINVWAQRRLKDNKIFCLSSNYISLAGPVDVVCFDKTGTLTESDLNIAGALPCEGGEYSSKPYDDLADIPLASTLIKTLATCHSLVPANGEIIGHPLDLKIFQALDWEIRESNEATNPDYGQATPILVRPSKCGRIDPKDLEVAILKTFPFQSKELRMTVVAKSYSSKHYDVYMKGAPEVIASLCHPSTVPEYFDSVLMWYTSQGLRVVALAAKTLPGVTWQEIESKHRCDLESEATFLGLVFLQNCLKPQTDAALSTLHTANINTVMITGDNLQTAISVAKKCGLISESRQIIIVEAEYARATIDTVQHLQVHYYDENYTLQIFHKETMPLLTRDFVFAMEGRSFDLIYQNNKKLFTKLVHRGKVYARMKPDQKVLVIEELRNLGHQVAMCGDGCNDCGALKAAHAGISLSSTEASVAAPFTSQDPNIDCVAKLVLEGRATLVSIYASFKYNISYCFAALIVVLILYTIVTEPSDTQYLIMDLILITVPSLVLGNTGAPSQLGAEKPSRRILSPTHIMSILSFLGIQAFFYSYTLHYIQAQSWFKPFNYIAGRVPPPPSYEETYLVIVAFYSFVIGAFVFSHGHPFRLPFYTNKILTIYLCLATILCIFMNFCTAHWFTHFINFLTSPSPSFSGVIFLSAVLNFVVCVFWERWVLYGLFDKMLLPKLKARLGPHLPFDILEKTYDASSWVKLSSTPRLQTPEPIEDEDVAPPSYNAVTNDFYDDDAPTTMRRLSRKIRFRASVRYQNETSPSLQGAPSPTYQEPFNFKFNKSVRHQILQGTSDGFTSFTGSRRKRHTKLDVNKAPQTELGALEESETAYPEPYESLPLKDMASNPDDGAPRGDEA